MWKGAGESGMHNDGSYPTCIALQDQMVTEKEEAGGAIVRLSSRMTETE